MKGRWPVLWLMFAVGLNMPMHFHAIPALAPFLTRDAGLDYTEIGLLTGFFMAPGILLAGPSALIAGRLGDRWTVVLGVALMAAAAMLFVAADAAWLRYASRLIGGAGGVVITVLLPKIVTDWFAGEEIATAQSIMASSFGVGIGVALAVSPAIATALGWQAAIIANAAVAALGALAVLLAYREHPNGGPRDAAAAPARISPQETAMAATAGAGRGLFSTGYVSFMSFAPPLLIAGGMAAAEAGLLASVAAALSIVSVPLGGYLTDRTKAPNPFIALGAIGTAVCCLALPYLAPALIWIVGFGVIRGGCTGGIMSMPAEALRPESRRAGFAVASVVYFIFMAAAPALGGWIVDVTGDFATGLWFAAALWLGILAQLALFRWMQRRWLGRAPAG